jgi:tripartite-type tricarboxylate transporter receptor subunit TctC
MSGAIKQICITGAASLGIISLASGAAPAAEFPTKPLRIVTGGAGGGNDVVARMVGQGLTAAWAQQVIVDNRPSGLIPGEIVARARPDGYTMVVSGSSFWISPLLHDKPPYDPARDFSPVILPVTTPNVVAVTASLPVKNIRELIALAKARPGELNYGTSGTGSSPHLGGELFKLLAGVNIVRVNYKSAGAALTELISGQVHVTFGNALSVTPHVKAGRLRALAVTSAQPSQLLPDMPTVAASGLPGYELISPFGIFAPAKTPDALTARLNAEIARVLTRPEAREKLFNMGMEVVAGPPPQLAAMVASEMSKWRKVIAEAGIRVE